MADPYFDENHILHMLSAPVSIEMIDYIQQGAVQALCDLYDRKVDREAFVGLASPCLALYAQCARLRLIASVEETFKNGKLDQCQLDMARDGIVALIAKQRDTVVDVVKKLLECPTSEDRVH